MNTRTFWSVNIQHPYICVRDYKNGKRAILIMTTTINVYFLNVCYLNVCYLNVCYLNVCYVNVRYLNFYLILLIKILAAFAVWISIILKIFYI
jgi:hypothetical protein